MITHKIGDVVTEKLLGKAFVGESCQLDVVFAETLAIVSSQGNLNLVVNVEPLGVMVHLVGLKVEVARFVLERLFSRLQRVNYKCHQFLQYFILYQL